MERIGMKRVVIFLSILLLLTMGCLPVMADNEGLIDEFGNTFAQGDVNGDGKVTAIDYAMVKRYVLRHLDLDGTQQKAADVNGDGRVNPVDYMIIKRVVLKTAQFPHLHDYDETVVGNLHIFTCKGCGHQYEEFDGQLIG